MKRPNNFDQFERREIPPLEVQTLDQASVMITEYNTQKRGNKDLFGDTFDRVRSTIESGRASEIPPIVVLQTPFSSVEKAIRAYQQFTQTCPRQGRRYFDNEGDILSEILGRKPLLLCYNGNRRLEEFQRAKLEIKAYVIKSQEEFVHMPQEERRIPDKVKNERPTQYTIDQNYIVTFLQLLDDVVYITAEKKYYDNLDTKKILREMQERRKKR